MSDFKAKIHQNRFRLGLCPTPHWGSLKCSPDPIAGIWKPCKKFHGKTERFRLVSGGLITTIAKATRRKRTRTQKNARMRGVTIITFAYLLFSQAKHDGTPPPTTGALFSHTQHSSTTSHAT